MIVFWGGPQNYAQAQARAIFVWNQSQVAAASGGTPPSGTLVHNSPFLVTVGSLKSF